jgi:hypothetical protein
VLRNFANHLMLNISKEVWYAALLITKSSPTIELSRDEADVGWSNWLGVALANIRNYASNEGPE